MDSTDTLVEVSLLVVALMPLYESILAQDSTDTFYGSILASGGTDTSVEVSLLGMTLIPSMEVSLSVMALMLLSEHPCPREVSPA